jgi:hypothetical protein
MIKFPLPLTLVPPQTLNTLHTTIWAEHLVRTSSLFEDTPFVFHCKDRLTGLGGALATHPEEPVNAQSTPKG